MNARARVSIVVRHKQFLTPVGNVHDKNG